MNFTKAQPISARRTYGGWTGAMRTSQNPINAKYASLLQRGSQGHDSMGQRLAL